MKKTLFATTAIVAAGFASSVAAAEWETGVSGYYYLGLALSDSDANPAAGQTGQDGLGVLRDGEVHVNGRLTADNGLTFRARVEIESFTSGDQIDENWGSVSGSFGTIMIGSNDDAVYNNHVGVIYAPGARLGYYDEFNITNQAATYHRPGNGSDQIGIFYTTPNFMGFQAYGSYHPNALASDGAGDTNVPVFDGADMYAVGASYNGDFGDFGVGLSGGYTDIETQGELITIGANVSFGGFTIAGTYQNENADGPGAKGDEFNIGLQYTTGPWTIAGGYATADGDGFQGAEEDTAAGWVTYAAAPGVSFTVGVEWADAAGVPGDDFGGLGYISLYF